MKCKNDIDQFTHFEYIHQHLMRKHGDKSITISIKPNYTMLLCDWNVYHLAITYCPSISFPNYGTYDVWLENNCYTFARLQMIGTKWWEKRGMRSQEEVWEYIKWKMRHQQ